jgi:branched-subunit amino acid transport protein
MTASATIVVLIGLALGTYAFKAAAPLVLGARPLPQWLSRLTELLPAALFAALVVVSTVTHKGELVADARIAGLGAAAVALARRAPLIVVILASVAATALVRAL